MASIRDKLWLWGHPVNSHYVYKQWYAEMPESRIGPAEAAFDFGIPNLLMVRYANQPQPPFEQYAEPMRGLQEVVWSILPAIDLKTGYSEEEQTDLDAVLELAGKQDNIGGAVLDDFFGRDGKDAALSVEQLGQIGQKLRGGDRKLDLWVVYYDKRSGKMPADEVVEPYLQQCDVLNYWTWNAEDVEYLEEGFDDVRGIAERCGCRIALGCYMFNYGKKRPMGVEVMAKQCRLGQKWLEEGSIDGMVFLASCICDLEFEAVQWARDWIGQLAEGS